VWFDSALHTDQHSRLRHFSSPMRGHHSTQLSLEIYPFSLVHSTLLRTESQSETENALGYGMGISLGMDYRAYIRSRLARSTYHNFFKNPFWDEDALEQIFQ